jgi:hypothetical protein
MERKIYSGITVQNLLETLEEYPKDVKIKFHGTNWEETQLNIDYNEKKRTIQIDTDG